MCQSPMIGRTLSHYEILEQLGEGGMGVVYKARDLKLQRVVALKFLGSRAAGDDADRARMIDEARAAAALDHPNICPVYEIGEAEGRIFISMAYLPGPSLDELIAGHPQDPRRALDIGRQIARALAAAHEQGILHRDVKSGNVIVNERGVARLLDFGLAVKTSGGRTSPDPGKGTPVSMSPEQLLRKPVDVRADIWSWGVVFYEMLTGRLPFRGDSPATLIRGILHEDPVPPSEIVPVLPPELDRVVTRALAKEPGERYPDFAEALRELGSIRISGGAVAQTSIAVLPFADLSPENDQAHLCEGLAEEIINDLARVEGLQVASRAASFGPAAADGGVAGIGRRLGVSSLLEGSVKRTDHTLRVTARLTNVADGRQLWSVSYDRDVRELLVIEEEIARSIVEALSLELTEQERRGLHKSPASDIEAYDFYLRGRQFFYRADGTNIRYAIEMFRHATSKDPGYARAWAGLADCHSYLSMYFGGAPEDLEAADSASRRALELQPDLAEAHAARGLAESMRGDYDAAELRFERAVELNPGLFEAWYFHARTCFARGALDRAARLFERAAQVRPEDYQSSGLLGLTLRTLQLPARAELAYRRTIERVERHLSLNPGDARAIYLGADALLKAGDRERALAWIERVITIAGDDPYTLYGVACFFAVVGDSDKALEILDDAIGAGFVHHAWIEQDSDFESLRETARFKELVALLRERQTRTTGG